LIDESYSLGSDLLPSSAIHKAVDGNLSGVEGKQGGEEVEDFGEVPKVDVEASEGLGVFGCLVR